MKSILNLIFIFGGIIVFNYVNAAGDSRCTLPILKPEMQTGMVCMAHMERYGYNSSTGKCEEFIYGGCGGNENNFNSPEECEKACMGTAS